MDLRKGAKSLQVFQIFKKEFNTAVLALGTHLSQKPREHLHLHTEKVPFVLDHDNDLEFCWAFHPQGRPYPCRQGPRRGLWAQSQPCSSPGERGNGSRGRGILKKTSRHCNSICRAKRHLKQYPNAWHLGMTGEWIHRIHRTPRGSMWMKEVL